jgi:DNA end-binding protein Ku
MVKQLIKEMSSTWSADKFRDTFYDQVMKLVEDKAKAGHVEQVEKIGADAAARSSTNVGDLTELLLRSVRGKAPAAPVKKAAAEKAPAKVKKAA